MKRIVTFECWQTGSFLVWLGILVKLLAHRLASLPLFLFYLTWAKLDSLKVVSGESAHVDIDNECWLTSVKEPRACL